MAVTRATILLRIRELLAEGAADFWGDDTGNAAAAERQLVRWYDDGAQKQHRIIFDWALRNSILGYHILETPQHPYMRLFLTAKSGSFTVGTQDYALSGTEWDMRYISHVKVGTHLAQFMPYRNDWAIKNLPQYGPSLDRPLWTIVPSGTGAVSVRFYVAGQKNHVPNAATAYEIYYYRDVVETGTNTNVDLIDPYNVGPVNYAVGVALGKEYTEGSTFYQQFVSAALNIVAPPEVTAMESRSAS